MRVAIHVRSSRHFFCFKWIEYFERNGIEYKVVDAYSTTIMKDIDNCDVFVWHFSNYDYRDMLFAKQLLYSIEKTGVRVFPNFDTCWHFDDKVGQKYLLEGISAPFVNSYVFYNKIDAIKWMHNVDFPKVFKLRGGSGSSNVLLVKNKQQCKRLINIAFSSGFSQFDRLRHLKERIYRVRMGLESPVGILKGIYRLFYPSVYSRMAPREKGYVYFQDYIPNNSFDIRVIVIGNKAFAIKRMVRKNDFRASGGGMIVYNKSEIDPRCIKIAFDVNKKLNTQCVAYDFVFDGNGNPLIIEISYGYDSLAYDRCPGFWDESLEWHDSPIESERWQIENIISQIVR